jgi:hypothetical protein
MADFLVIGAGVGAVTVPVVADGARRGAPLEQGIVQRGASGRQGGAVTGEKWTRAFTTAPLSVTEYGALLAAVPAHGIVQCSGDALGGAVRCVVEILGATYERASAVPGGPATSYGVIVDLDLTEA